MKWKTVSNHADCFFFRCQGLRYLSLRILPPPQYNNSMCNDVCGAYSRKKDIKKKINSNICIPVTLDSSNCGILAPFQALQSRKVYFVISWNTIGERSITLPACFLIQDSTRTAFIRTTFYWKRAGRYRDNYIIDKCGHHFKLLSERHVEVLKCYFKCLKCCFYHSFVKTRKNLLKYLYSCTV